MNLGCCLKSTGQFGVAKVDYYLVDSQRKETNVQIDSPRELMLHIWYPTALQKNPHYTPYDADALEDSKKFMSLSSKLPLWLFAGLYGIQTHTYVGSHIPIATDKESYPIIILLHGQGTMVQHYTWIGEELASQGYMVIGINHPYMAAVTRFRDKRMIKSLVDEKGKKAKIF